MVIDQKQQRITFFLLFAAVAGMVFFIWLPFLKLLALGAIFAILFSPVHQRLLKEVRNESLAAFLTVLLIVLIILLPIYLLGQALFNELSYLFDSYKQGGLVFNKTDFIQSLPVSVQNLALRLLGDINQKISGIVINAFTGVTAIFSNLANFVVSLILIFFTSYYLLRDGKRVKNFINMVFPLSVENKDVLLSKIEASVNGMVKGSFLIALIQGAVAVVGFLIFGVPAAFLWGAFTVLAALVPNVGTSLALVPAVIYLLITGQTGAAVGMAIWGALAVGTIDNIVSPKLLSSKTKIHPLLVLFSVIGGLNFFGPLGFLLGPILMAIFLALLDIYRSNIEQQNH
ncbi:MAG: AI-2E family transporter [Candidatus Doudnabacteria bacterium]|jgi:predicted PurR-regulated permease PerM